MICTVPMRGSEVANCKKEIHLTNTTNAVMRACNVTTIDHDGNFTLLGIYMLLRLVEIASIYQHKKAHCVIRTLRFEKKKSRTLKSLRTHGHVH